MQTARAMFGPLRSRSGEECLSRPFFANPHPPCCGFQASASPLAGAWNRGRAFTLIELLIVAGILAILAAIALPNFMAAQARAKSARARSDLRNIATALEAYRTDSGSYPPARTYCAGMMSGVEDYNICPLELTTPVAYISTRFTDVFNRQHPYKYVHPGRGWANETFTILAIWVPRAFPSDTGISDDVPYFDEKKSPVPWAVWSAGPSGARPFDESDAAHVPVPQRTWYDPTNGAASEGVITRLGTGHISP